MRIKKYIAFFIFLLAGKYMAAQPLMNHDTLVARATHELYTDYEPYDLYGFYFDAEEEETPKSLDSIARAVEKYYYKNGLWIYPDQFYVSKTTKKILSENYGVRYFPAGSEALTDKSYNEYLYNACMKVFLKEIFGWNIIQKVTIKAQQVDAAGGGDRQATFPNGGYEALNRFVYCQLDYFGIKSKAKKFPGVEVSFYVHPTGKVDSLKVLRTLLFTPPPPDEMPEFMAEPMQQDTAKYSREVLRVLRTMPNWLPATENGKPRGESMTRVIYFMPQKRQKYKCNE